LCRFYDAAGELRKALDISEQLLSVAQRSGDPALVLEAHHSLWATLTLRGELRSVLTHAEEGARLYDPQKHGHHAYQYGGHDPGVCGLASQARALWILGFPDKALQKAQESLVLARTLAHPFSLFFTTFVGVAWVHEHRGESRITEEILNGFQRSPTSKSVRRGESEHCFFEGCC
jgi:hypothetical protein